MGGGVDSFSQTNNLEIGPELRWSTLTFADRLLCPAGLPWWFRRKESACQCRRWGFDPLGREDPLEKEMATHSSTLVWEMPQTEEPGGPQSP